MLYSSAQTAAAIPQNAVVTATPDTAMIRIGEQFRIHLKAVVPAGARISFPVIPDTMEHLEIISRSKVDTSSSADSKSITYHQALVATSFDSGYYAIPPFHFMINGTDTISTEAFLMTVTTIPVDTTREIKDIKPPMDVPFSWKELIPWLLLAVALMVLTTFLIRYFKNRKKKIVVPVAKPKPVRPAHELALEALKKIEAEKLWQQGYFKQYHSQVSDTVRTYIEHRFSIPSLESTTEETMTRLKKVKIPQDANDKLRSMLELADLVKFAKVIPLPDENTQSISDAFDFVMQTKPVTESDFKNNKPEAGA